MKRNFDGYPLGPLLGSWELALTSENKSDRTVGNYLEGLDMFCRWLDDNHPMIEPEDITSSICRQFVGYVVETRSSSTGRTRWSAMRQFFAWAAEEEEILPNPMENVRQPAVEEQPVEVLSTEEVRAVFATCSGSSFLERRDRALMMLLADTGMRVSALAGAKLPDLNMRERTVVVTEKGRKVVTKPFGVATARALDRYLRARARSAHPDSSKAVFVSARDGSAMNRNSILQMLKRRGREAGVPGLHPHMFRHTFVDRWLRAGGSEGDLMELVNWNSREMLGRYAKVTRTERAREAHRRLSPMDNLEG